LSPQRRDHGCQQAAKVDLHNQLELMRRGQRRDDDPIFQDEIEEAARLLDVTS
jgi:hypothetical protein